MEKHLAFGEFWQGGLLSNTVDIDGGDGGDQPLPLPASPSPALVMGKLQGPRANPGTTGASAGFMTITKNAYYKWIFYATVGDEVAFGIARGDALAGSLAVSKLWRSVAAERGLLDLEKPNRFLSWLWTEVTEATADAVGARASVLGVETVV